MHSDIACVLASAGPTALNGSPRLDIQVPRLMGGLLRGLLSGRKQSQIIIEPFTDISIHQNVRARIDGNNSIVYAF